MYNEQIEQLISAALADGVLTEKEKQILFKKAQSMGIDLDEFEMVLDARLVELAKAEKTKADASALKSNKLGDVKKCPACGAIVQSFQGACPECGYAFENIDSNKSSQKLVELIDKVLVENNSLVKQKGVDLESEKKHRVENAIKNFPVPTTKSDLFEFITSLQSKTEGVNGTAYKSKLNECIEKAKLLFPDDKMFRKLIDSVEANQKMKKKRDTMILLGGISFFFAIGLIGFLFSTGGREHTTPDKCLIKVQAAIDKGNYKKAEKLIIEFTGGRDGYDGSEYKIEDCHESVVALERALLKEGRLEEAEEIYDIYVDKVRGSLHKEEYIEKVAGPIERYKSKIEER